MTKRVMVYGDSNSWGYPPDGSGRRFDTRTRWPQVMAGLLGIDLIEECLPGRTTAHDDPELLGPGFAHVTNGLRYLPVALKGQSPVHLLIIMLGTNDLKVRFTSSAEKIADNLMRLVACARDIGGGATAWEDDTGPEIALIVPPHLPLMADDPGWERVTEWTGGRRVSLGLATAIGKAAAANSVKIFDAAEVISGAAEDPIHLTADSQRVLGTAAAHWIGDHFDGYQLG